MPVGLGDPGGGLGGGAEGGAAGGGQQHQQQLPQATFAGGPPISEEIDWRNRALEAEERCRQLEGQLSEINGTLAEARRQLEASQLRAVIDRELSSAGVIDPETAMLLVERSLDAMETPDAASAVSEVKRRKPFLFRQGGPIGRASSMSGLSEPGAGPLRSLADSARDSGDRKELMEYMRARRQR